MQYWAKEILSAISIDHKRNRSLSFNHLCDLNMKPSYSTIQHLRKSYLTPVMLWNHCCCRLYHRSTPP